MRRHRVCDQRLAAPKVKQHAPLRPCRRVEISVPLHQYGPTERCPLRCNPATDAQLTATEFLYPTGFLIEVHYRPKEALSDGRQSLAPEKSDELMCELRAVASAIGRS
jgi:hypothetical protein